MGFAYATRDDMRMRLHRSIVRYKEDFYIADTDQVTSGNWYDVLLIPFDGSKTKSFAVDHRLVDFDPLSPDLGYLNHNGGAYYAARTPERRQVQGLNANSISFFGDDRPGGNYFNSKGMYNMLTNQYPKIGHALSQLFSAEAKRMAVHRHYAIGWMDSQRVGLYRKGSLIGYRDDNTEKFVIIPSKESSFISRHIEREKILG